MKKLLGIALLASLALAGCGDNTAENDNADLKKAEEKIESLSKEVDKIKEENTELKDADAKVAASKKAEADAKAKVEAENKAKAEAETKAKAEAKAKEESTQEQTTASAQTETPKTETPAKQETTTQAPKQTPKTETTTPAPTPKQAEQKQTVQSQPKRESGTITGEEKGRLIATEKKKLNNPNLTQSERNAIIAEIKRLGQLRVSH
ncbi:hypothetical protein HCJ07_13320 [Listeria booriae]|uniref:hypothetical protein n=1 Tax=Listeria booriae TaxID=1552123 RepID=UPI00162725E8|nr:hypothetical protein [Listeria booriae]MBC1531331.1 hypothetical protein [Listeria booriae]